MMWEKKTELVQARVGSTLKDRLSKIIEQTGRTETWVLTHVLEDFIFGRSTGRREIYKAMRIKGAGVQAGAA